MKTPHDSPAADDADRAAPEDSVDPSPAAPGRGPGALEPFDSGDAVDPPVFPEGALHPEPGEGVAPDAATPAFDESARGERGRYGLEEEPPENSAPVPRAPRSADQAARDRDRDRAVRESGEDLG